MYKFAVAARPITTHARHYLFLLLICILTTYIKLTISLLTLLGINQRLTLNRAVIAKLSLLIALSHVLASNLSFGKGNTPTFSPLFNSSLCSIVYRQRYGIFLDTQSLPTQKYSKQ